MSIQLTPDQETELASLAAQDERTPDDLAQEAVADMLAFRSEHHRAIEKARESVAAGRLVPHEEVLDRLKQRLGW